MTRNSPSAYVLVGPTASGKSSVAQILAEQTGALVVSADSMNIYRGMDIGTAKPAPAERGAVRYFGIDLADPTETFSVGDWLRTVRPAFLRGQSYKIMKNNHQIIGLTPNAENKVDAGSACPIVAGGTGLYVKCLLQGLDDLSPANEALRERAETMTLAELQAEAQKTAPEAYAELADKENPRRLIRLLEHGGLVSNVWKNELPLIVGLSVERDELHRRIAERVEKMYANGLLDEARGLADLNLSPTAQHAIGYAEAFAVLRGELTEAEAKEKTIVRTRQLAKRQMTWFRHQLNVEWIETADFPDIGKLAAEVSNVWKNNGAVSVKGV
ncbi:MAG: tRNA (adenosine(37)-N6)-dimethylallyltransferase MiaA [Kiritimatiellales bacterium]